MYLPPSTSENLMWHTRMENLFRRGGPPVLPQSARWKFPTAAPPFMSVSNQYLQFQRYNVLPGPLCLCHDLRISWKLDLWNLAGERFAAQWTQRWSARHEGVIPRARTRPQPCDDSFSVSVEKVPFLTNAHTHITDNTNRTSFNLILLAYYSFYIL